MATLTGASPTNEGTVRHDLLPRREMTVKPTQSAGIEDEIDHARVAKDAKELFALVQRFESGQGAARNLARAKALIQEAAELGDAKAMYRAAQYAEKGLAGEPDSSAALQWYEKAAAAGETDGYAAIARMYLEGKTVAPDSEKAALYIEKGLQAGSPLAMFFRGMTLLDSGAGPDAIAYLQRASELGNADAQAMISSLYQEGKYVPQDAQKAIDWARTAAANGSTQAQVNLAKLLMTSEAGASAEDNTSIAREIADNLNSAEQQGSGRAALELAGLYLQQKTVTQEAVDGMRALFTEAYDLGRGKAAVLMAMSYALGPDQDLQQATSWLNLGAKDDDWMGKYALQLNQQGGMSLPDAIKLATTSTYKDFAESVSKSSTFSVGVVPPVPVNMPMPTFPSGLGALSVDGSVTARFSVNADGKPVSIQILGSTHPELEAATLAAISQWTFKPATKNGSLPSDEGPNPHYVSFSELTCAPVNVASRRSPKS